MTTTTSEPTLELLREHYHAGRFIEAEKVGRAILLKDPNHPDALAAMSAVIAQLGRPQEGMPLIRRAIVLQPNNGEFQVVLSQILQKMGRWNEAVEALQMNAALAPNDAVRQAMLGDLCSALRRDADALVAYDRAIALKPDYAEAHNNRGLILDRQRRRPEAIQAYQTALKFKPESVEILANLGASLEAAGRFDEALAAFRQAIVIKPDYALAYSNIGSLLSNLGRFEESLPFINRALELSPNFAVAHNNRGLILARLGRLPEAEASFVRSLQIDPNFAEAHWNRALTLLSAGEFSVGWAEYEWRWKWDRFSEVQQLFAAPEWDGSDPGGRTILLHAEQGQGDTIQFVRYAALLEARGASVVIECKPGLGRLIRTLRRGAQVIEQGQPRPLFHLHLPILSLPHRFRTTLQSIPASIPYLAADPVEAASWRERLTSDGRGIHVGIAWAGNPGHASDLFRSFSASVLAPLARVPQVILYSLQKGDAAAQLASLPAEMKVIDHTAHLKDFADTAALIANLDLVVTADTAVAHLAGAMGKPVWLMLSTVPDWRWLRDRIDTPWYPTMRLFRQPKLGDWASVAEAIARELADAIARGRIN